MYEICPLTCIEPRIVSCYHRWEVEEDLIETKKEIKRINDGRYLRGARRWGS